MADISGLLPFVHSLRNQGMLPHIVGDLSRLPDVKRMPAPLSRVMN
jgi:hypothetical protein